MVISFIYIWDAMGGPYNYGRDVKGLEREISLPYE